MQLQVFIVANLLVDYFLYSMGVSFGRIMLWLQAEIAICRTHYSLYYLNICSNLQQIYEVALFIRQAQ